MERIQEGVDIDALIKKAVDAERARCEAWCNWGRRCAEGDIRSVLYGVRGGGWPTEDEEE